MRVTRHNEIIIIIIIIIIIHMYAFALLNMQSLRHSNHRQMVHTHAQASVRRGRCHSVVKSSSTHRQRSYSK
jgi:uncharacterized protein YpmB